MASFKLPGILISIKCLLEYFSIKFLYKLRKRHRTLTNTKVFHSKGVNKILMFFMEIITVYSLHITFLNWRSQQELLMLLHRAVLNTNVISRTSICFIYSNHLNCFWDCQQQSTRKLALEPWFCLTVLLRWFTQADRI